MNHLSRARAMALPGHSCAHVRSPAWRHRACRCLSALALLGLPALLPAAHAADSPGADSSPPTLAAPVVLQYDGKGLEQRFISYTGHAELHWSHDASHYQAQLDVSAFGMKLRSWSSTGALGAGGLLPERFDDAARGANWRTEFQRDKGVIAFSSGTPDQPLLGEAQDKLSALLQLGVIVAANPQHHAPGTSIAFQAADAHRAERWSFAVHASETLDLPGGSMATLPLVREPTPELDQKIEVWLAPGMNFLPVRLRITESDGNFLDLAWRKSQNTD